VEEAKTRAVEEEDLRRLAPLAEEDEERAAARVAPHPLGNHARQAIEAPTQVDGLDPDEHLDAGWDHARASVSRRRASRTRITIASVSSSTPARTSTRPRSTSMSTVPRSAPPGGGLTRTTRAS